MFVRYPRSRLRLWVEAIISLLLLLAILGLKQGRHAQGEMSHANTPVGAVLPPHRQSVAEWLCTALGARSDDRSPRVDVCPAGRQWGL
jgi:hypothetical protein